MTTPQIIDDTILLGRSGLAATALLVYDAILCFDYEWNLIWSKRPLSMLDWALVNATEISIMIPYVAWASLMCFFVPIVLTITASVLDIMDHNTSTPRSERAGIVASTRDCITTVLISRFLLQLGNLQDRKENEHGIIQSHAFSGVITTGVPSFQEMTSGFYEANIRSPSNARREEAMPTISHQRQVIGYRVHFVYHA
ncbi:uncharacterized protein BXZ73DRAFT_102835 [Epithele typhae]|uniref:uncharacterized protein n=1 Tax=Epithele typhae TaxID=378194 RepID=UPI0020087F89|nr:uncharacterized protein BXZ73DRAFT_102835 [Epithele typhae]KAH9926575.1 hypothetical protein BXZ73DRAFT_102835 [Epithele typhae]